MYEKINSNKERNKNPVSKIWYYFVELGLDTK